MKSVVIGIALLVLLIASGNLRFEFWSGSTGPATAKIDMRSATVRDVVALTDAASLGDADLDNAQSAALIARFERDRDRAATHAIERAWPSLSRRIDGKLASLYRRVAATPVATRIGVKCRASTLVFLRRQRRVFRHFSLAVARRGATPSIVDSFIAQNARVYDSDVRAMHACTAGASSEDRAALEPVIQR